MGGRFSDLMSWSAAEICEGTQIVETAPGRSSGAMQMEPSQTESVIGLPSRGSSQHSIGKCKPCAFVHRPVGCAEGFECKFCHSCSPGEKKRRQKKKLEAISLQRLARRAANNSKISQHRDS